MKKILFSAVIAMSVAAPAYAATSGNTSTTAGSAQANVISPIVLTHAAGATLNFGSFTTGSGGTVSVTAASVGSTSSDVGFVPGSVEAADQFTVAGDVSRSFSISTGPGSVAYNGTTISFITVPSAPTGKTDSSGAASFTVGGTLTLLGSEPAGGYSGTYNATVTYN